MTRITYIWHDCFVIETDEAVLVFDYWEDPRETGGEMPVQLATVAFDKPLYVLVSHHHKDHYNKDIFGWGSRFTDIHYILSRDTARFARHILSGTGTYAGVRPPEGSVTVLAPGDSYDDGRVQVRAFASTDIGNSYYVRLSGKSFFHAGDLNAWLWRDESTPSEIEAAWNAYDKILTTIALEIHELDYAMFPVDSRIGSGYWEGAKAFAERIPINRFFPMHLAIGNDLEIARHRTDAARFELYANRKRGEYILLTAPGDSYFTFS